MRQNKYQYELSVILPVHNEEGEIERVIDDISRVLKKNKIKYEIICVENGSTDNSPKLLKNLSIQNPNLKILQSKKGWGNAIIRAIPKARGHYFCYMVSDGQVNPNIINIMFKAIKKNKLSLVKIRRVTRENMTRLINSRIYNFLTRLLFNLDTIDINGTPKLIETRLIREVNLKSENIAIDLELLLKLKSRNLKWMEFPVKLIKRESGISTTNLKAVWEMISYMRKFYFNKQY